MGWWCSGGVVGMGGSDELNTCNGPSLLCEVS